MSGIKTSGGNAAFHNFVNDFAHITDPNERRRLALAKIDNAPFGWYHVRAIVVAGIGFFTDSYDIFSINICVTMLGYVYFHNRGSKLPTNSDTAVKVATSGGTVVGQLFFGWIADIVGRKRIYGIELMIIIVGTLGQALSGPSQAIDIIGILAFWRVIMGVGIGGDYPLSSIITSEFATTKWRGAIMGAVFANQGWGQLAAAIVALCATAGFKKETVARDLVVRKTNDGEEDSQDKETSNLERAATDDIESSHSKPVSRNTTGANENQVADADVVDVGFNRVNLSFAESLDLVFLGITIRARNIFLDIGRSFLELAGHIESVTRCLGDGQTVVQRNTGWDGAQADGDTPRLVKGGLTVALAHGSSVGRLEGVGLYVLCQLFMNWGPNTTTFIVPGECFPTRYRSTAHGISAASGKIGAIIAQTAIAPLRTRGCPGGTCWLNHVMEIFALFMLLGFFVSFLIPETKRETLEDICERLHGETNYARHTADSSIEGESTGEKKVVEV
ncbi:hypothetical protein LIPSTDRAFT_62193 [Lipomyces starkeyi NRRL Y-11557]|uniref:Major facilitator superfamily (MFS) profile domain-containing protein n=1 Tax=Lipomyces starkeyi NRRL Y-11557 TaxID=675824 RepID=A0A1E3QAV7_LIPST|nr:hypothetical protein LIPSTDRAFT_62193 [Lipomyces starkeyi NRRL Y-11557]